MLGLVVVLLRLVVQVAVEQGRLVYDWFQRRVYFVGEAYRQFGQGVQLLVVNEGRDVLCKTYAAAFALTSVVNDRARYRHGHLMAAAVDEHRLEVSHQSDTTVVVRTHGVHDRVRVL